MKQRFILAKNSKGKANKWFIESENEKAYQVSSNGIITYLYKNYCSKKDGCLFSSEVRQNDYPDMTDWFDYIYQGDKETDIGYLEPDDYGLDYIYSKEGEKFGV